MEPLLTTDDVAGWLRVDVVTVRRLINKGELPAYRVGGEFRFKRSDLEEYLDQQRVPVSREASVRDLRKLVVDRVRKAAAPSILADSFSRFTTRAKNALTIAQREAERLNHNYIGTEHVLLGLIEEGSGVAATVLRELGVERDAVQKALEPMTDGGSEPESSCEDRGLTPRVKKVLELAVEEARTLGHQYIGTEHLLLGLMREGEGMGARVLRDLGVEAQAVRRSVVETLQRMK
jgi:excisionase family DNA binding protein